MRYVAIFHANLNYAYLEPHKYEQVIRASYETIFDVFRDKFPEAKYVFEASGFTIDTMAEKTPDVLKKLRAAIESGQCEFMGAPYAHPIMANVPEEDGRWACVFAQKSYQKHLGLQAESWWNPECTWMQYVPYAFRDAGAKYLTLDFESYMNCNDKEYSWVERNRAHDINWGGNLPAYDLDPDHPALHFPFHDIIPGLHGMCRSDRLINRYIRYFRDRCTLKDFIDNVKKWTGKKDKGSTIIIADDAEYCGTSGYFFVKYYQDYSRSFQIDPDAGRKLTHLVEGVLELGPMGTFKEACEEKPVNEPFFVEDRYAWHRTYADAWAGTPEARAWDPILAEIRRDYKENLQPVVENRPEFKDLVEKFWFHLTCSANSDGRWPPPPALTCPFNREWVLDQMEKTRKALAQLKKKAKGLPKVKKKQDLKEAVSTHYGYFFTEKDETDVRHLNLYELQHALYSSYKLYDHDEDKTIGRKRIQAIYNEYKRRGWSNLVPPDALKAPRKKKSGARKA